MTAADKTPALSASAYKNIPSVHFSPSLMEKLAILTDAANMMLPAPRAVSTGGEMEPASAIRCPVVSAIHLLPMDDVFPCLRSYLPMNVSLTAPTVRITVILIFRVQLLHRRRSARLRLNFTAEIILRDFS